jgi:hypothetical protein
MEKLPVHARDCALVTTHHLTCTCGAMYRSWLAAQERWRAEHPDPRGEAEQERYSF